MVGWKGGAVPVLATLRLAPAVAAKRQNAKTGVLSPVSSHIDDHKCSRFQVCLFFRLKDQADGANRNFEH